MLHSMKNEIIFCKRRLLAVMFYIHAIQGGGGEDVSYCFLFFI